MEVLRNRTGIFRCRSCKVDFVLAEDLVAQGDGWHAFKDATNILIFEGENFHRKNEVNLCKVTNICCAKCNIEVGWQLVKFKGAKDNLIQKGHFVLFNHCISKWGGPTVGYLPELAPLTPGHRIDLNVWPNPEPKDSEGMEKKQQKIPKPVSGSLPFSQASINRNVVRPMDVLESRTGIFRCKVCKVDIVCAEDLVTKGDGWHAFKDATNIIILCGENFHRKNEVNLCKITDICCTNCNIKLGWQLVKFKGAKDNLIQKGHFVLFNHCISEWGGPTIGYLPELKPLTHGYYINLNVWPEPKDFERRRSKRRRSSTKCF